MQMCLCFDAIEFVGIAAALLCLASPGNAHRRIINLTDIKVGLVFQHFSVLCNSLIISFFLTVLIDLVNLIFGFSMRSY
jgi:hypothetical protein